MLRQVRNVIQHPSRVQPRCLHVRGARSRREYAEVYLGKTMARTNWES